MEEWFRDYYEEPINKTPRVGGEYLYIWGGPYNPFDELGDEFGHLVPEDRIQELAKKLVKECIHWGGTPRKQRENEMVEVADELEADEIAGSKSLEGGGALSVGETVVPPSEPVALPDQLPRTHEVSADFGSGIDYLGSVAADAKIAARIARRAATLEPNQSVVWPGLQGSPDPAPLAIRPTIYPTPPGETVIAEDPVTINIHSAEFRDFVTKLDGFIVAVRQSNEVAREVGDKTAAARQIG
jgi:hypothetical protein